MRLTKNKKRFIAFWSAIIFVSSLCLNKYEVHATENSWFEEENSEEKINLMKK